MHPFTFPAHAAPPFPLVRRLRRRTLSFLTCYLVWRLRPAPPGHPPKYLVLVGGWAWLGGSGKSAGFGSETEFEGCQDIRWKAGLLPEPIRIICALGARAGCGPHHGTKTRDRGVVCYVTSFGAEKRPSRATPLRTACPPTHQRLCWLWPVWTRDSEELPTPLAQERCHFAETSQDPGIL
eukprot:gene25752-biopygen16519